MAGLVGFALDMRKRDRLRRIELGVLLALLLCLEEVDIDKLVGYLEEIKAAEDLVAERGNESAHRLLRAMQCSSPIYCAWVGKYRDGGRGRGG